MNKKIFFCLAIFIFTNTTNIFSLGLGLQGNINADNFFSPGAALTFKLDSSPLYFAVNWQLEDTNQTVGITADYWVLNETISYVFDAPFNIFLGIGGFCNLAFNQDSESEEFQPSLGLRVPFGVNMYLFDGVIEPFLQISPSFGVKFIPTIGANTVYWPISFGCRIWF